MKWLGKTFFEAWAYKTVYIIVYCILANRHMTHITNKKCSYNIMLLISGLYGHYFIHF